MKDLFSPDNLYQAFKLILFSAPMAASFIIGNRTMLKKFRHYLSPSSKFFLVFGIALMNAILMSIIFSILFSSFVNDVNILAVFISSLMTSFLGSVSVIFGLQLMEYNRMDNDEKDDSEQFWKKM